MDLSLFKNKNYCRLMLGKFVSMFGTRIQSFALALYVLKLTNSSTLFASILIAASIPNIILSPFAGVFVDMWNRKKIIVNLDYLNGILLLIFSFCFFISGSKSILMIISLVVLQSVVSVLFYPAAEAILPNIVPDNKIVSANSLSAVITNSVGLAAPIITVALLAIVNIHILFIINAVSFILSGYSESKINVKFDDLEREKVSYSSVTNNLKDGLIVIRDSSTIKRLMLIAFTINLIIAPIFTIAMPILLKQVLRFSDVAFAMYSSIAITPMIIAPLLGKKIIGTRKLSDTVINSYSVTGILLLLLPLSVMIFNYDNSLKVIVFAIILACTFGIGFFVTIGNISHSSYFHIEVPNELLGRVGSVFYSLVIMSVPMGQALLAICIDKIGLSYSILSFSIILLINLIIARTLIGRNRSNESNIEVTSLEKY